MKKIFVCLILVASTQILKAQVAPLLDPKSFLLPRYNNLTHITSTITSPSEGMMVYNTNTQTAWYYDGVLSQWKELNTGFSVPLFIVSATTTLSSISTGMSGEAGNFQITNLSNASPAVSAQTSGTGNALYVRSTGTNRAANIGINNVSSGSDALFVSHNGTATSIATFSQNSGLGGAGYFQISNASNNAIALQAQTQGTGRALSVSSQAGNAGYFTSASGHALIIDSGNAGFGTSTPSAKVEVNGFTKLGTDAPAIKMKEITLTTSSVTAGFSGQPHGLTLDKILSVNVLVAINANLLIPPAYEADPKYKYTYYVNDTQVFVVNQASDCTTGNYVCSKPARILITYKQ